MLSSYRACAGLLHARAHRVDGVGRVWTGRLCHRVCAASIRARAAGCICIELGSVFGRPCSFPLITLAALIYVDNRQEHNRPVRIAMFGHFYDRSSRVACRTCKHESGPRSGMGRYEPNASFFYELMSIARRGQRVCLFQRNRAEARFVLSVRRPACCRCLWEYRRIRRLVTHAVPRVAGAREATKPFRAAVAHAPPSPGLVT